MHQLEISIPQSHTNTPLNRINFNYNFTSINLGEYRITTVFWVPDGSPVQIRINSFDNLPTVGVIPIPDRAAEIANFPVTLTIASLIQAFPILDMTENPRMVDLLAYMKTNLRDLLWGVTDQPTA